MVSCLIKRCQGRHTGTTELPLTANGEKRMRATGKALVGEDRLIVPRNLAYVSFHLASSRPPYRRIYTNTV